MKIPVISIIIVADYNCLGGGSEMIFSGILPPPVAGCGFKVTPDAGWVALASGCFVSGGFVSTNLGGKVSPLNRASNSSVSSVSLAIKASASLTSLSLFFFIY